MKNNYEVNYIGLREGYKIILTNEEVDDYTIFSSYILAKYYAMSCAKNDIKLVKEAYQETKKIRKKNVT